MVALELKACQQINYYYYYKGQYVASHDRWHVTKSFINPVHCRPKVVSLMPDWSHEIFSF